MDMIKITKDNPKKKPLTKISTFLKVLLILTAVILYKPQSAGAAEGFLSVKEINYEDSTITLQLNQGDTAVYFSDSLKKNWEIVPGKISADNTMVMDISWVSLTSNYVITLKGNRSTGIISVVIPKQATNFRVSYDKVRGTISFSNAGARAIEWRKKDSSVWSPVNISTFSAETAYYCMNGAILYFRLAPINGSSNTDVGCRASKEVSLTIPKKTAAPSVSINGSKFTIGVKRGMAYRTVRKDGSVTEWQNITKSMDLLLSDIAPQAMYSSSVSTKEEVTLQFRTNATSSAQVSNIATVMIPVQEGMPSTDKYGINLNYTSSTSLSLQVKAASSTVPFEYTIVKPGYELRYQTAGWTAISSSGEVSITKTAAPVGSHIYVRKKSIAASEETEFSLASADVDVTGSGGVAYPSAPKLDSVTNLVSIAGVCKPEYSSSYLSFTMYSPTKTTVSSMDFYNAYGNKKGSVTIKSTVAVNPSSSSYQDKYIITTKITSTSSIDSVTKEVLYANISLASSETIISTETTGIHLYLYPSTKLNNGNNSNYTNDFKRMYLSNVDSDASSFQFQLDFGTAKVIDPSGIDKDTSEATAVKSIQYNGYRLVKDTDYSVTYGSYVNEDSQSITTATVTINAATMEKSLTNLKLDQKIPLVIELNNNEVLNQDVFITLVTTAKAKNTPIAWSITEGSLQETKTSTVTDSNGNKSTVTEEVITYTLELEVYDTSYAVSVSDVTWGETSILGSASVSSGKITITLKNAKINKLTTNSTDTKNIVITLSNGYVINSGIKLTIIKAY